MSDEVLLKKRCVCARNTEPKEIACSRDSDVPNPASLCSGSFNQRFYVRSLSQVQNRIEARAFHAVYGLNTQTGIDDGFLLVGINHRQV